MFRFLFIFSVFGWIALEIWLFLLMGDRLGVGLTLVWLVVSALLGMLMMRLGAMTALMEVHQKLLRGEPPAKDILDMGLILLGGMMLIFPTFFTDFIGLTLGIPPFRMAARYLVKVVLAGLFVRMAPPTGTVNPPFNAQGGSSFQNQDENNVIEITKEES